MSRELHEHVKKAATLLRSLYQEYTEVVSIRESLYRDYMEVHILSRDLFEEIADTVDIKDYKIRYIGGSKYPYEAYYRTDDDIEYFYLIKERDQDMMKKAGGDFMHHFGEEDDKWKI